jgi:hypothetical protein
MIYTDSTTTSSFLIFLKEESTISDMYLGKSASLKTVFNKMADRVLKIRQIYKTVLLLFISIHYSHLQWGHSIHLEVVAANG